MTNTNYTDEGILNLFEAVMQRAYEDAKQNKNLELKAEAQNYINEIKKCYA